jgi:hypothetical protein
VPVDVEGLGTSMRLQLDTGSSRTELYSDALPGRLPDGETFARAAKVSGWGDRAVTLSLHRRDGLGSPGEGAVGTAGTDLFPNGFVLDFPARKFCQLTSEMTASFLEWHSFERVNGSPVIVGSEVGQPIRLLIDTGSSGFTLLSTGSLSRIVDGAERGRTLGVPSFGRTLRVTEGRPVVPLSVLGQVLDMTTVYAFEDPQIEGMLRSAGLNGLIGLRPFTKGRLAFDFRNSRVSFAPSSGASAP